MRLIKRLGFVVLMSSLLAAQSSPPADSDGSKIQKLLDAVAAQQKAIAEQQQQITQQQQEIEKLKQRLTAQPQAESASNDAQVARTVNASLTIANPRPEPRNVSDVAEQDQPKESPLSFKIGGADFTPGGFMDFTGIFRSVNTGNSGGTNFFNIPFNTSVAGHLTETRFSAQNSRISLKAHSKFGENDVTGYYEMDFLGNDATNVFVTSNSHTFRQRLYWLNLHRGKFEVLAGQSWSWLTPNRVGLSPLPADVFYSQDMDFNYQVGLTWTRAPQVRFAYHPNSNLAIGVALENPEQFAGQANMVVLPAGAPFNAQLTTGNPQLSQAASTSTPNLHPDVIPKIAYDTDMGGKHFHAEVAGLLTSFRIANTPTVAGATFVKHTKTGGGASAAVNFEVVKNFRIVANGFYSDGGGRYVFGMAPGAVVLLANAPGATCTNVSTGTPPVFSGAGCDLRLSLVHTGSGIGGFEAQITPKTMIYGYYGGLYVQRNFALDLTAKPGTIIGYGGPGEANAASQNRAIQEGTIGWIQTFWKNPQFGALQLITQASYLTRAPWFVAVNTPKNAHLGMGWVDLRYVLP